MPKKAKTKAERSISFDIILLARLEKYLNDRADHPSVSAIVNQSVAEFLSKHESIIV